MIFYFQICDSTSDLQKLRQQISTGKISLSPEFYKGRTITPERKLCLRSFIPANQQLHKIR